MARELSTRRRSAVRDWLSRPKLWDDVFTRTVANLLSVSLIGLVALAAGYIKFDRRVLGIVWFFGGLAGLLLGGAWVLAALERPNLRIPAIVRFVVVIVWGGTAIIGSQYFRR